MNKAQEKTVRDLFKTNPNEPELIMTADGQFFLSKHKNLAEDHAKRKSGKKRDVELKITVIKRPKVKTTKTK